MEVYFTKSQRQKHTAKHKGAQRALNKMLKIRYAVLAGSQSEYFLPLLSTSACMCQLPRASLLGFVRSVYCSTCAPCPATRPSDQAHNHFQKSQRVCSSVAVTISCGLGGSGYFLPQPRHPGVTAVTRSQANFHPGGERPAPILYVPRSLKDESPGSASRWCAVCFF